MAAILIAYAGKTGVTMDAAEMLAKMLPASCDRYDLEHHTLHHASGTTVENATGLNLLDYRIVLLGTAMYCGRPRKAFLRFFTQSAPVLESKKVFLFTCGIAKQEENRAYLLKALPADLDATNLPYRHLGGELRLDKLSPFWRYAMKGYLNKQENKPCLNLDAMQALAQDIVKEL